MKFYLRICLMILLFTVLLCFGAYAATYTSGDYVYSVENGEATIEEYTNTSNLTSLTVPSTLGGYPVKTIGSRSFYKCSDIENVVISDGITTIGSSAFYKCENLSSVTIGDNVTSIGDYAFSGCESMTSVTIPGSVSSIGTSAFDDCFLQYVYAESLEGWLNISFANAFSNPAYGTKNLYFNNILAENIVVPDGVTTISSYAFICFPGLKSITISDSVTSIGDWAFADCTSLKNVTIGANVTNIGDYAFRNCSRLTSAIIPDSVKTIDPYAFTGCDSLSRITIGNGLTNISDYVFSECTSLTNVTIPDNITSIGDSAFYKCSSLASATIENGVTNIGPHSFNSCGNLTSVTIPDSVISIGDLAFNYCQNLMSVTIGSGVTNIGSGAFRLCYNLQNVYADSIESWLNISFADAESNPMNRAKNLYFNNVLAKAVVIPESITSINNYAFYDCNSLTSVIIPDSVTNIGDYAFYYCNSLPSIIIPDSVTSIGEHAFCNCDSLTSIIIPDSVTSIGDYAFLFCDNLIATITSGSYAHDWCVANGVRFKCAVHTEVIDAAVAPTYSDKGLTEGKHCSVCNEILIAQEVIPELGHTEFIDEAIAPTCTGTGLTEGKHCPVCGEVMIAQEIIDALGHTEVIDAYVAPTCTETGLTKGKHCSVCGEILVAQEIIPELGHTVVIDAAVSPTCTDTGLTEGKYCSVCTEVLATQEIIPALGHTEVIDEAAEPTCIVPGLTEGKHCSVCGEIIIPQEIIEAGGHTPVETDGIEATDFTDGKTAGIYCSVCNEALSGCEIIPAFCVIKNGILTKYNGTTTDLAIPADLGITSIGYSAFEGNPSLISVSIPEGVISIGAFAFSGCSALEHVDFPESLQNIGSYAFADCSSLADISVPDGVQMGQSVFGTENDPEAGMIRRGTPIGENLKYISYENGTIILYGSGKTYPQNSSIESINAWDGWLALATHFTNNNIPVKLVFEYGITELSNDLLTHWIDSVVIPESITSIDSSAFANCRRLKHITLPESLRSIDNNAFANSPDVVATVEIGSYAHKWCVANGVRFKCAVHTEVIDEAVEATCVEPGLTEGKHCSVCGEVLTAQEIVPALGHTPVEAPRIEPTDFVDGRTEGTICATCNEPQSGCETIPAFCVVENGVLTEYTGATTELIIPETLGIKSIGYEAFKDNATLTSVVIPEGVTSIGYGAFSGCNGLTSVVIPEGVTSIGSSVFHGCSSLTSVVIPEGVTSIGGSVFGYCSSLMSVVIPDSVTSIGNWVFEYCSSLTSVVIPDSVISIGSYAFHGCCALTNIVIPEGVTSIGGSAFGYCSSLTKVVIPEGVTSIGDCVFEYCSSLTSVVIPEGVTSIGYCVFTGCSSLTSVVIPEGVTSIGDGAFRGCGSLTSVVIPENVVSIGDGVFHNCSGLTSVVIPEGVTSIGDGAFRGCGSLASVVIPEGVTSIGNYSFSDCYSLTRIKIPDGVISIGDSAFSGCDSLTIYCKAGTSGAAAVSVCGSGFVDPDYPDFIIHQINHSEDVSGISIVKYIGTDTEVVIPVSMDSVLITEIDSSAFTDCSSLTKVVIPEGVTSIGNGAFRGCGSLTSVVIPEGVTSIGGSAFGYCSSLTKVVIPEGVTSIGDRVFSNCSSLASVVIPEGVTSIGNGAFRGCSSLASVVIPEGVTSIGNYSFSDCYSLTRIKIPDGVISIGDSAFFYCSSLTSVDIPESVTYIGNSAFQTYSNTIFTVSIGSYAHAWCETNNVDYRCSIHTEVTDEVVAPTCTTTGLTEGKHCEVCGDVLTAQEVVPALGHTEVIDAAVAPTCTATGLTEGKHCSVCGEVLTAQEIVPALGHVEVIDEAVAPTYTTTGLTEGKHCERCGVTLVTQVTVPALLEETIVDRVKIGETVYLVAYADGSMIVYGSGEPFAGNFDRTEAINGRDAVMAYYQLNSIPVKLIINYGINKMHHELMDIVVEEAVLPESITAISEDDFYHGDSLKHIYLPESIRSIEANTFSKCPDVVATVVIGSYAHQWCEENDVAWRCAEHTEVIDEAVAPTCTATGLTEGKHCSVCGEVLTAQQIIPALGHIEVIDEAVAPTYTTTGLTEGKHCERCGATLVTQVTVPALLEETIVDRVKIGETVYLVAYADGSMIVYGSGEPFAGSFNRAEAINGRDAVMVYYELNSIPVKLIINYGINKMHYELLDIVVEEAVLPESITAISKNDFYRGDSLKHIYLPESIRSIEANTFSKCPDVVATVVIGSYAHQWCEENDVAWRCAEHTEVIDEAVAPTCTETGLTEGKYCSVCGEVLRKQEIIPPLGHTEDSCICTTCGETFHEKTWLDENQNCWACTRCSASYHGEGLEKDSCSICGTPNTCKHENAYGAECWVNFDELMAYDATGHEIKGTLIQVHYCDDCHCSGWQVEMEEDIYRINHCFADGVCIDCGYDGYEYGCPHPESLREMVYTDSTAEQLDASNHLMNYKALETRCAVCYATLASESVKYSETVRHHFNVGDIACSGCGYISGCLHANTHVEYSGEDVFYTGEYYSTVELHNCVAAQTPVRICDDCGVEIEDYDLEIIRNEYREPHTWVDGVCACGMLQPKEISPFVFTVENGEATVVMYTGTDAEVEIPAKFEGYPVVKIGLEAFFTNEQITSVVVPEGVTTIGPAAFEHCRNLSYVTLPGSLRTIEAAAFAGCSLEEIALPNGLESIGNSAFAETKLQSIVLPDSVTQLGDNAFAFCFDLNTVTLSENITSIDDYTFDDCFSLESINLPKDVNSISETAFNGCINLTATVTVNSYAHTWCVENGIRFKCAEHTEIIDTALLPTCTSTGLTEGKHCSVCNEVLAAQEVVPALGHTEVIDEAVAPACTVTGLTEGKHCSVCGEVLVAQEIVPALGHTPSATQQVYEVNVGSEMYVSFRCLCGHNEASLVKWGSENPDIAMYVGAPDHADPGSITATFAGMSAGITTVTADFVDDMTEDCVFTIIVHSDDQMILPAMLKALDEEAFMNAPVQEVILPEGMTVIGERAFADCAELAIIHMPDSIASIADNAFAGCENVTFICTSENVAATYAAEHGIPYVIVQ